MTYKYTTRVFILASFVIVGTMLRFYLASQAYPELVFDAKAYADYAQEFLRGSFPLDPRNKNMGYPLFLAIVYWVRGVPDVAFVKLIQIFLDLGAGVFVWVAAQRVFSRKTADLALLLYMMNPFTSSYTGIILPEVVSSFLVGALLMLTVGRRWFFVGLTLGLLLFVKSSLLFFAIGSIALMRISWKYSIIFLVGFLIASSYTLLTNYRTFGRVLLAPPYSTMFGQTYVMSFYAGRYPEVEFWGVDSHLTEMMAEYEITPDAQIPAWNKRYFQLFVMKATHEPLNFFSHYLKNIFWLWDKDHLFVYEDPWYPADRSILRVVNLIFLGLCLVGIIRYVRCGLNVFHEPFVMVTLLLGATMTLLFPLVSNESRHTIPFYPLLFFWSAYAISRIRGYGEFFP